MNVRLSEQHVDIGYVLNGEAIQIANWICSHLIHGQKNHLYAIISSFPGETRRYGCQSEYLEITKDLDELPEIAVNFQTKTLNVFVEDNCSPIKFEYCTSGTMLEHILSGECVVQVHGEKSRLLRVIGELA